MLYFQQIRTARFTFTLQELSIADTRVLLNIPVQFYEKTRNEFLKKCVKEIYWNNDQSKPFDLSELTIQERIYIESIYLMASHSEADFGIGELKLSDYLMIDKQYQSNFEKTSLGVVYDEEWFFKPLTGIEIEVIESLVLSKKEPQRLDWFLYAMAASCYREKEEQINKTDPVALSDYIEKRASVLETYPERLFADFLIKFMNALKNTTHLFNINFDEKGVVCLSQEKEGADIHSARFLSSAAILDITKTMVGKAKDSH